MRRVSRFVLHFGDHSVRLGPGTWRIGRDPICEVHLDDESVSRRHAILRVRDDRVTLRDHESRNGVHVNGERIFHEVPIGAEDRITVGTVGLRLVEQNPTEANATGMPPTRPLPRMGPSEPQAPEVPGLEALSPRERTVLEQLARGKTQREVAEHLEVSVKTVETYRARIAQKLGLKTRADLVEYALEAGILREE
jgi:DNA-binding CsgD family transcriptional regulator